MDRGKIVVTVPDMDGADAADNDIAADDGATTIKISSKAGITNPTKAGMYAINVSDDPDGDGLDGVDGVNVANVIREVSLDPTKAGSGSTITVKGTGYGTGTATVFIDAESDNGTSDDVTDGRVLNQRLDTGEKVLVDNIAIDEGSFTVDVEVDSDFAGAIINAQDSAGDSADESVAFTLDSSISVSPTEISFAETLTITLSDWPDDGDTVESVMFAGNIPGDKLDDTDISNGKAMSQLMYLPKCALELYR